MTPPTIHDVANYFVCQAHEAGDLITNLKVQKLAYYAQAWNLALRDEPLVAERFEAWVHGPVSPTLYGRFKEYRWNPISEEVAMPELEPDVRKHLDAVQDAYGAFSALELERMTHAEEPWLAARGELDPTEPSQEPISEAIMRSFYAARAAASSGD
jgi:uncharacterized phage-associated protein